MTNNTEERKEYKEFMSSMDELVELVESINDRGDSRPKFSDKGRKISREAVYAYGVAQGLINPEVIPNPEALTEQEFAQHSEVYQRILSKQTSDVFVNNLEKILGQTPEDSLAKLAVGVKAVAEDIQNKAKGPDREIFSAYAGLEGAKRLADSYKQGQPLDEKVQDTILSMGAKDFIKGQADSVKKYGRDIQDAVRGLAQAVVLSGRLGKKAEKKFLDVGVVEYIKEASKNYTSLVKKYGKSVGNLAKDSAKRLVKAGREEFEQLKMGFYQVQNA